MLVMKFGGTSVGGADQIVAAARIVAAHYARRPVVVVSAITKVTDLLLATAQAAGASDRDTVRGNLRRLSEIHRTAIDGAISDPVIRADVSVKVAALLARLRRSCTGIVFLGELSPRSLDAVAATGERCSALIVAGVLRDQGIPAEPISATDVVVTDGHFGAANPQLAATRTRAEAVLRPLIDAGVVPVVTGFIGATAEGAVTTLGRGGSDYSASIIGGALGAAEIWIWTDVPGVMSADPRIVPDARTLPRLSYAEAAELSYYGAKVIHPRTIIPAVQGRIPIWIKNTFAPDDAGTLIGPGEEAAPTVSKAITSIRLTGMITVTGAGLLGGPSIVARVFTSVARRNANLFMISQSSSEHNVCFVVNEDVADQLVRDLQQEFAAELAQGDLEAVTVLRDVSVLAVVGAGMRGTPGVAGRVFSALGRSQVNIIAIAQGSSELNISFAVHAADERRAVQLLHDELVLGRSSLVMADQAR
ncbi:MAG: aspartate kinase [Chloroflexi bacterium]|nr:aspartate kinase [Chloroflexota bacterium]